MTKMAPVLDQVGSKSHTKVIEEFRRKPSEQSAGQLVDFFRITSELEAVADLARALAESGARLSVSGRTADIASTGGPSSLSTLLCPLFLVQLGFTVPKLGVQGRPAGGIDVMAQLPGFDISPSPEKVHGIINQCQFAHFLADDTYAPLDQLLFRFRQKLGAQAVRNLTVASILAKKLAVGLETAGLEVRVFPGGNFGEDMRTAIENARFFGEVAARLKIRATSFVTDCTAPYQPFIGRGEAILALHELFHGEPSAWLASHAEQCWRFVSRLCTSADEQADVTDMLRQAREVFEHHLQAHGSSPAAFLGLVSHLNRQPRHVVESNDNGFVDYNLAEIRDFIVQRQRGEVGKRFPDPAGVQLLKRPGVRVARGEAVLSVRLPKPGDVSKAASEFFWIVPESKRPFEDIVI